MDMAEHLAADDLKGSDCFSLFCQLVFAAVNAVHFVFYPLLRFGQLTGDTGDSVVVHQSGKPVTAVGKKLVVQIIVQLLIQKPHCYLCRTVTVLCIKACP